MEVLRLEVIGRAAAPVHNVLILALAAQLTVPISDAQVVIHHGVAVRAVLQDRVEKGLQRRKRPSLKTQQHTTKCVGLACPFCGPSSAKSSPGHQCQVYLRHTTSAARLVHLRVQMSV